VAAKELCRKHGFSDATFCKLRSWLGATNASVARRLKDFEGESSKRKKPLADAMRDIEALKVVARRMLEARRCDGKWSWRCARTWPAAEVPDARH